MFYGAMVNSLKTHKDSEKLDETVKELVMFVENFLSFFHAPITTKNGNNYIAANCLSRPLPEVLRVYLEAQGALTCEEATSFLYAKYRYSTFEPEKSDKNFCVDLANKLVNKGEMKTAAKLIQRVVLAFPDLINKSKELQEIIDFIKSEGKWIQYDIPIERYYWFKSLLALEEGKSLEAWEIIKSGTKRLPGSKKLKEAKKIIEETINSKPKDML